MPCRAASSSPLQPRGGWTADPHLLVQRLPIVPDEGAVHDERVPAHQAVEARERHGQGSAAVGPNAQCNDGTQEHHRACLRHSQTLDGLDTLPDQREPKRGDGDEPERAGVQLQTRPQHPWLRANQEGDEGAGGVGPFTAAMAQICELEGAPASLQRSASATNPGWPSNKSKPRAAPSPAGLPTRYHTASLRSRRSAGEVEGRERPLSEGSLRAQERPKVLQQLLG